ncbi:putative transcriptional regulator, GntR family [Musicola paradisiaca Ech703]|uniref:Transcriptional regulator, GntR family n=1 Tax=Musicola paradisiaca (strain Ech703) TaxID=579405 RepID=C6C4S6_MUSP7|nr:putative transcriptional regulator, GntR family [Musicola paradisiaca Ech703]
MTRYQHLADLLAQRIEAGLYQSGERLPSVRTLSHGHGVRIGTVQTTRWEASFTTTVRQVEQRLSEASGV